jgi:hypothetical protein
MSQLHPYLLAQLEEVPSEYLIGGGVLAGLLVLLVIWRIFRRKRAEPVAPPEDLSVQIFTLGEYGPPKADISLELYNLPVRLAAVILAPTGRGSELPSVTNVPRLVDHIVPGLSEIVLLHKPTVRRWPAQLSTQGFSNTLFSNVRLPGDHGKGTPWSIVAGRFETGEQNILAGLVLRAVGPNSLGQFVIDRPGQWLDLLRVRRG